ASMRSASMTMGAFEVPGFRDALAVPPVVVVLVDEEPVAGAALGLAAGALGAVGVAGGGVVGVPGRGAAGRAWPQSSAGPRRAPVRKATVSAVTRVVMIHSSERRTGWPGSGP